MSIILLLLRIIGRILLFLLLLIALLLAVILLVPLRYELRVRRGVDEGEAGNRYPVRAAVHWLLHLLTVRVWAGREGIGGEIDLCGKRLKGFGKAETKEDSPAQQSQAGDGADRKQPQAKKNASGDQRKAKKGSTGAQPQAGETVRTPARTDQSHKPHRLPERAEVSAEADKKSTQGSCDTKDDAGQSRWRTAGRQTMDWIASLPGRIPGLVMSLLEALQNGIDALDAWIDHQEKRIRDLLRRWEPFMDGEAVAWYRRILRRLKKCLKHYRIRRADGRLSFGTGSPDTTAVLTGLVYQILPTGAVTVEPDLYDPGCEADLTCRGRVRSLHVLILLIRMLCDKGTWTMLGRFRRRNRTKK